MAPSTPESLSEFRLRIERQRAEHPIRPGSEERMNRVAAELAASFCRNLNETAAEKKEE